MSKEHHQMRIRLPLDLRDQVEEAAKSNNRTMNAEIVHRLEESLFREQLPDNLMPADKAKELSDQSRKSLPAEIFARVITSINRGVSLGHNCAMVDLEDFDLELMEDDKSAMIVEMLEQRLTSAGYKVSWDGLVHIMIDF